MVSKLQYGSRTMRAQLSSWTILDRLMLQLYSITDFLAQQGELSPEMFSPLRNPLFDFAVPKVSSSSDAMDKLESGTFLLETNTSTTTTSNRQNSFYNNHPVGTENLDVPLTEISVHNKRQTAPSGSVSCKESGSNTWHPPALPDRFRRAQFSGTHLVS